MAFTENPTYVYNRGQLWMGDAVAGGMPTNYDTDIAAIDSFEITLTPTYVEHVSKQTTVALKDVRALSQIGATGKIVCSQRSVALMKKWLYASSTTIAGGSLSATAFAKNPAAVSDILPIPSNKTKMSSVVITDSNGSPATLVLGTDYELDADAGLIKILSLGSYTQPFKMPPAPRPRDANNFFQSVPALQGLRFKGNNITNNNGSRSLKCQRSIFQPAGAWKQLGDGNDAAKFEWDFEILADAVEPGLSVRPTQDLVGTPAASRHDY
jgi:hypothetical protein